MANIIYNVLWVDDQKFQDIEDLAIEEYNIQLQRVDSWEEAETFLKKNYDMWSAIILDCYCKKTKDGAEDEKFLKHALHRLDKISGDKRLLPWYVLSAGNRDSFENIIDQQLSEDRLEWDREWEKVYYSKTYKDPMTGKRDIRCMLENISRVAANSERNKLRILYADALSVFPEKESELLSILDNLNPDKSTKANCLNDIRKMMEYIMERIDESGLLLVERNGTNLNKCSKFLGQSALKEIIGPHVQRAIHSIVEITNTGSHNTLLSKSIQEGRAPYVLRSTIFELLVVVYWCKNLPSGEEHDATQKTLLTLNLKIDF